MLAPALAVIGLLFVGGLVFALAQSLGHFPPAGEHAFTLAHYRALLFDQEFRVALWLTFALASVSTIISSALGLVLALTLREVARRTSFFSVLLQVPLAIPHLAMAIALVNLIAPSGLVARLAFNLRLIGASADFPSLIADRFGIGIVIAYVLKETPFIALTTLAVLVRLGDDYELVARTLGASTWQRLRHVTLPLVAPAVISSALIVFAFVFSAFEVPFILGRTYPSMLAVVAERRFMSADLMERPAALAVAFVAALIAALLAWGYMRLARALVGVERPIIF